MVDHGVAVSEFSVTDVVDHGEQYLNSVFVTWLTTVWQYLNSESGMSLTEDGRPLPRRQKKIPALTTSSYLHFSDHNDLKTLLQPRNPFFTGLTIGARYYTVTHLSLQICHVYTLSEKIPTVRFSPQTIFQHSLQ